MSAYALGVEIIPTCSERPLPADSVEKHRVAGAESKR